MVTEGTMGQFASSGVEQGVERRSTGSDGAVNTFDFSRLLKLC